MALNSLLCADMPLRNCSLAQSSASWVRVGSLSPYRPCRTPRWMNVSAIANLHHTYTDLANTTITTATILQPPGLFRDYPGEPGFTGARDTVVSGSGISWAICKSAPRPRQITMPASHHSVFFTGRMPNQQRQSTEGSTTALYNLSVHGQTCRDYGGL